DVADLPLGTCGGFFPGAGRPGHREHAFRLIADDLEDGVFPLVGHGVPRAHRWFLSWRCVPAALRPERGLLPPVPPKPGFAREFTIRTPAHPAPACQWRLSGRSVNSPAMQAETPRRAGWPWRPGTPTPRARGRGLPIRADWAPPGFSRYGAGTMKAPRYG